MPDLDDLLDPSILDAAANAARTPAVAGIEARGVRRRRRTQALAIGGAAAAVALVVGIGAITLTNDETNDKPAPAHHDKDEEGIHALSPEEVVHHPRAQLAEVQVAPDDPEARASTWRLQEKGSRKERFAVAYTTDGFETAQYLRSSDYWSGDLIDSDHLLLNATGRALKLVRPDGTIETIEVERTKAPLQDGEVMVAGNLGTSLAVDLDNGTAHRWVQNLDEEQSNSGTGADDRFITPAVNDAGEVEVRLSDDGGATWERIPSTPPPGTSRLNSCHLPTPTRSRSSKLPTARRAFPSSPSTNRQTAARPGNGWNRSATSTIGPTSGGVLSVRTGVSW